MKLKLSCADFSFPLLSHDAALNVIGLLGMRGVDIGLFANRGHLRPEKELRNPGRAGTNLRRRLSQAGLPAADVFLQVHDNFADYAINHPEPARRTFARRQFLRALEYAAAAGSEHITILPGVVFKGAPRADSVKRATEELQWRVERAAKVRLTVAVEPHLGSLIDTPARALQLVCLAPGLGVTLDYAHFTRAGIPDARIEPLAARATHFHARCARRGRLQCGLKENTIDFGRALAALGRQPFQGWVAVEYVWIDWEHCNDVDVLSETIQLTRHLKAAAKTDDHRK